VTLQGDWYTGESGRRNHYPSPLHAPSFIEVVDQDAQVDGGNLMLHWRRELGEDSDWSLRTYYDRTERKWLVSSWSEDRDTFDIDFQHRFPLGRCHSLNWGAAYRITRGKIMNSPPPAAATIIPNERTDDLISLFFQDEITLLEDLLSLTVGTKLEWNDYTDFEAQPTARILWTPSPQQSVWASISRAVRTPTWAEDDITVVLQPTVIQVPMYPDPVGVFPTGYGSRAFDSEELIAYEGGIRVQQTDALFWDVALFFHQYENLRSIPFDPNVRVVNLPIITIPAGIGNGNRAHTYGFELAANYEVTPCWKLFGSYSYLQVHGDIGSDGGDPRNQFYAQSSWDLGCHWQFDLIWRYVDNFGFSDPFGNVAVIPAYHAVDLRLAWMPRPALELGVVARNLLDRSHPEFPQDAYLGNMRTEVENEVYGFVTWRY
jgi:iron complex outermembrane receptor protein